MTFKAKAEFKLPKLTIEQKVLKKVVTEVSKNVAKNVKEDVKSFRQTGALSYAVGSKVISQKGNAYAIVGVKSRYTKDTKKGVKIPNQYAKKANEIHRFLERHINKGVNEQMKDLVKKSMGELIKHGN